MNSSLYDEICRSAEHNLAAKANPANVIRYSRYFKDGYNAWGVDSLYLNELCNSVLGKYQNLNPEDVIELGKRLFAHGKYEMASLAIMLLQKKLKQSNKTIFHGLKEWFDNGVGNWAHSDFLCSKILPYFLLKDIVEIEDFSTWLKSTSKWTRRAVPVSLIAVKKILPVNKLLSFTEELMTDPERVVHQGMGWFLRELWKLHPTEVEDFLYKHRNDAARLIIQYATEKISKEERLRFRKDKPK
ncbi:MAG: DNA alkylation repair protein [Candidatus Cloacimonetes bacterium]|jgi:3-methyladenine DNA glycosylase AlkD|nr:DNA alkylation repair protein [Candidatus Cloacimonadota bacterium]MCK9331983.1 DNA alkylation repair protein [Candidatus Cloacimonadota bacterium]MDD3282184.1 DNA alkylation repair protein [Candidatus Cloacimonadota bacterium]MDD4231582.1 DNA alkylation repair protein [Candidatus Cloacimonadota bacterium]MDY0298527.1 DNA alkylation repair protein [Candidatus Cloacimonadaceae bacterium]